MRPSLMRWMKWCNPRGLHMQGAAASNQAPCLDGVIFVLVTVTQVAVKPAGKSNAPTSFPLYCWGNFQVTPSRLTGLKSVTPPAWILIKRRLGGGELRGGGSASRWGKHTKDASSGTSAVFVERVGVIVTQPERCLAAQILVLVIPFSPNGRWWELVKKEVEPVIWEGDKGLLSVVSQAYEELNKPRTTENHQFWCTSICTGFSELSNPVFHWTVQKPDSPGCTVHFLPCTVDTECGF